MVFRKKNFNVTKKIKKKLINLILSLKENERETIKKNINEVLNHRIINDAKNLNEAKLRYKLKKHNFAQNIIKKFKIFFKYILINWNFGNFCFFMDKNKYNYNKLYEVKIKLNIEELNLINSYLLKNNDIKNS